MAYQHVPAFGFLVEKPHLSTDPNVAADEVRRKFVSLVECDLLNIGEPNLIEHDTIYGLHTGSLPGLRYVRNVSMIALAPRPL